jgi:hypothetical protein
VLGGFEASKCRSFGPRTRGLPIPALTGGAIHGRAFGPLKPHRKLLCVRNVQTPGARALDHGHPHPVISSPANILLSLPDKTVARGYLVQADGVAGLAHE